MSTPRMLDGRPPTCSSGKPVAKKVVVQHRSDMLMDDQVQNVKNVQEALQKAMQELESARTPRDVEFHHNQVEELRQRLEGMMVVLKIVHKVNNELVYARLDLQKALKDGGNISQARRRVGWLEDRVDNLLGKRRQRSFNQTEKSDARLQSQQEGGNEDDFDGGFSDMSSMGSPKHSIMSEYDAPLQIHRLGGPLFEQPGEDAASSIGGSELMTNTDRGSQTEMSEKSSFKPKRNRKVGMIQSQEPNEGAAFLTQLPEGLLADHSQRTTKVPSSKVEEYEAASMHFPSPSQYPESTAPASSSRSEIPPPMAIGIKIQQASPMAGTQSPSKSDRDTEDISDRDTEEEASSDSTASSSEDSEDESEVTTLRSGILTQGSRGTRSRRSKGSRVTVKTPTELDFMMEKDDADIVDEDDPDRDLGQEYWNSEHHRFQYNEHAPVLLQLDPLSYHQMGLAVPGTFVNDVSRNTELPWRPKTKSSDTTDIHERALDNLSMNINKMYNKVREASLLSVRQSDSGEYKGPTLMSEYGVVSREAPVEKDANKPTLSKHGLNRPDSKATVISFPPLDKERLGSSLSNRLIYYPNPLPYPDKLPITLTNRAKEFPPCSDNFSKSVPGVEDAAERIVDQRNLLKETKFTSSLFRSRVSVKKAPTSSEKRFRRMLMEEEGKSPSAKPQIEKKGKSLKATMMLAKTLIKFQGGEGNMAVRWKDMKPKSGALEHSGLKWERVKAIVHSSLISPNPEERVDAARHLGLLSCGDSMVLYALRERLRHDEHERVIYEATKSLITLGCWDEEVMTQIVHYLLEGNRDVKQDLLKAMIVGKNVQYVDKKSAMFKDLSRVLSLLCRSEDPDDEISFHAAVTLGKLCVVDDNAKVKLRGMFERSENTHQRAQALEIMVRQMNQHDQDVVQGVLKQLQHSPVWKHRKEAARQLIHLGSRWVLAHGQKDTVFEILERRLWDDPNKAVRLEVAKVLAALDLFAKACEKVEKKLEDQQEEVRVEAVISVGTLGMKNERIIRALLEMIDLDPSPYVRLMIIRTFGVMNCTDKRVLRVLRVREAGDGTVAKEARRTLEQLTRSGPGGGGAPSQQCPAPGSRGGAIKPITRQATQVTVS